MKNLPVLIACVVSLSIVVLPDALKAQGNFTQVAQSGMQYLKIGVDAAMVGRGEAGISYVKGVPAIFWNPAGLADLQGKEFYFSHNLWIADISMDAVALGLNMGNNGAFALSAIWMDYGKLNATAVANSVAGANQLGYVDEGTFSPTDLAIGLAYSLRISEQFSVGGQVRFLYENYGQNTIVTQSGASQNVSNIVQTFSFDMGTLYYPGFKSFAFAMSIQNFSPAIKYQEEAFSTPLTFKLGVSMNMLDLLEEKPKSSLLLAVDAIHPRDYSERLNVGLEYSYLGLFQVRAGYRSNYDVGNYTTGVGIRYSFSNETQINLDVSYMINATGIFSNPLQITAGLMF